MSRTILHVDMDAFFASVEQRDRPELRGRPVIVGAPADQRGVVAAASYEARRSGVRSAMPSRVAARLCPDAVFLRPRMDRYAEISRQILGLFDRFTPLVEPVSIDEAFLDVTGASGLHGTGPRIAQAIKAAVRSETGLTCSVGVAPNKFLAKLASELHKPDGLTLVPFSREGILAFLAPLPAERIPGVGKVLQAQLEAAGVRTIGDLQALSEPRLASVVGRHAAAHLGRLAIGEDDADVETDAEEKSLSREHTFDRDCRDMGRVRDTLRELADDVGRRLRALHKFAGVARVKVRWADFRTLTRQASLPEPACDDVTLRAAAMDLLDAACARPEPVRLVGFGVGRLTQSKATQLTLFASDTGERARREELSRSLDKLQARYGTRSIRRGIGPDGSSE